jgi:hypothetical protein
LNFWGPSLFLNVFKHLALWLQNSADFTAASAACQPRATLQICNEKALAIRLASLYIQLMEKKRNTLRLVRIGNAYYAELNGMITRFVGMAK